MEIYTATQIIIKHKEWFHNQENLPKLDEKEVSEAYRLIQNLLNPVEDNVDLDIVSKCCECGVELNEKEGDICEFCYMQTHR